MSASGFSWRLGNSTRKGGRLLSPAVRRAQRAQLLARRRRKRALRRLEANARAEKAMRWEQRRMWCVERYTGGLDDLGRALRNAVWLFMNPHPEHAFGLPECLGQELGTVFARWLERLWRWSRA